MAANNNSAQVDYGELVRLVHGHLASFYNRRVECLNKLELKKILMRKNPYLFRAIGLHDVGELIQNLLSAYSSSSDETIFGNEFFEPLARDLAKGKTADGEGVDVLVEKPARIVAYAVKSGTSVFNSSSRRDQEQSFSKMRNRLFKTQKQFDAVVGYCYGRKAKSAKTTSIFREVAGEKFWFELTGDADCYIKILQAMQDYPDAHRMEFKKAWERAVNRFSMEFMINFMSSDGSINWPALLRYNSGEMAVPWKPLSQTDTIRVYAEASEASPMVCEPTPVSQYLFPAVAEGEDGAGYGAT